MVAQEKKQNKKETFFEKLELEPIELGLGFKLDPPLPERDLNFKNFVPLYQTPHTNTHQYIYK